MTPFLADLAALALPGRMPPILERRRAQAILVRVRIFALLFTVLTLAWIAVDAFAFEGATFATLALARVGTAVLLAALGFASRIDAPTPGQARMRLAALFVISSAFFAATQAVIPQYPAPGVLRAIASTYSFFPFLLAAGIGAFPLAIAESAALAAMLVAIEAATVTADSLQMMWLLFLIAGASAFAAASQLKLMAALVEQAVRDPLTGCLRRESGGEILEAQFLLAVRQGEPLTVLFADLDRFKAVNDAFGHDAGDHVLAAAAAALRAIVRESDVMIRWGGEEFVVVLPRTASAEAATLIQRLRATGFGTVPDGRPVTMSIGVAEYRADAAESVQELVALADRRMYLAKEAGRNRYVLDASGAAYPIVPLAPGFGTVPGAAGDSIDARSGKLHAVTVEKA
jgi:diguanylate cyclase (GGDEF)-like protein